MRFGYVASCGTYRPTPIMQHLFEGLPQNGHTVETFRPGGEYDCVILQWTGHAGARWDCDFNRLKGYRIALIDWNEYGSMTTSVHSRFDYCNGFTPKCFAVCREPAQLHKLFDFLKGRSFPYFSRDLFKQVDYPPGYYPLEGAGENGIDGPGLVSEEEFLARQGFLYVSWNYSHPHRIVLAEMMRAWATRCGAPHHIACNTNSRVHIDEYHAKLQGAMVSVSYEGWSVSHSQFEIMRRCCLVRNEMSRLRPFLVGRGCVEYRCDLKLDQQRLHLLGTDLVSVLDKLYRNKALAYAAYRDGHGHADLYTPRSISGHLAEKVARHDWGVPTEIENVRRFCVGDPPPGPPCTHSGRFTVCSKRGDPRERTYQCSCGALLTALQMQTGSRMKWLWRKPHQEID